MFNIDFKNCFLYCFPTICLFVCLSLFFVCLFVCPSYMYSDTVGRSGMFCAIMSTIERCKAEGVVDVFQVIKALRTQKPGAILNVVCIVHVVYTCTKY